MALEVTNWQHIELARHKNRPYTLDYINGLSDDFIELHGDRLYSDDKAIVGGLATVDGKTIMFIGHQKGRNVKERQMRNFGMAKPSGYRKALRLMKIAEHFAIPIVIFIDTPGADACIEAETTCQGEAIAHNLQDMLNINTPIISIIIGEGASGGALGLAIADKLFMLEHSWFSVISPEGCSSILWGDVSHKEEAAKMLHLSANDVAKMGFIDGIINEPRNGAQDNSEEMIKILKTVIMKELQILSNNDNLKTERIEKYKKIVNLVYEL